MCMVNVDIVHFVGAISVDWEGHQFLQATDFPKLIQIQMRKVISWVVLSEASIVVTVPAWGF